MEGEGAALTRTNLSDHPEAASREVSDGPIPNSTGLENRQSKPQKRHRSNLNEYIGDASAKSTNVPALQPKENKVSGLVESDALLKNAIDSVAYNQDKQDYWRLTGEGFYVKASERNLARHLRRAGMALDTPVETKQDAPLHKKHTLFDEALCQIQDHRGVDCVFDLAGHKPGLFRTNDGRSVLVPRGTRPIVPVRGRIPNFEKLFDELFGGSQSVCVMAWLKVALQDIRTFDPESWRHSQMLVLVGARQCGKSFFQDLITLLLGGSMADPYDLLVGNSQFSKDTAEAAHWKMDDKPPIRNLAKRMEFGANVKHHCVSSLTDVHGKGVNKLVLPTYRRITLSTNEEPEYLSVIPPLDDSMADKLMIVHCSKAAMIEDYKENRSRFVREAPAMVDFLQNVFKIPDELRNQRTGVNAFVNPTIREMMADSDPKTRLSELIDLVLFKNDDGPWKGTAAKFQSELFADPSFGSLARQILPHSSEAGRLLRLLQLDDGRRFSDTKSKNTRTWLILRR